MKTRQKDNQWKSGKKRKLTKWVSLTALLWPMGNIGCSTNTNIAILHPEIHPSRSTIAKKKQGMYTETLHISPNQRAMIYSATLEQIGNGCQHLAFSRIEPILPALYTKILQINQENRITALYQTTLVENWQKWGLSLLVNMRWFTWSRLIHNLLTYPVEWWLCR